MTRTIPAGEVTPGTLIEYSDGDITPRVPVHQVAILGNESVKVTTPKGRIVTLPITQAVTVLTEPVHVQPEEPTEFGAKVTVDGEKFLRAQHPISVPVPWLSGSDGKWRNWAAILAMGPVTVVPDQGWTVPDDAPEVPERIEVWPEDDEHLRAHRWVDSLGRGWRHGFTGVGTGWSCGGVLTWKKPFDGPWTRVTDA